MPQNDSVSPKQRSRDLGWGRKVLLALASPALFLGGLEVGIGVWDWLAYGTVLENGQAAELYDLSSPTHLRLHPNVRLDGWKTSIHTNALGYRGAELDPDFPADGIRIWCVGGSTTFDIFAPDDAHAWPALLEKALREALPGRAVEVINAGIPGETAGGSAVLLEMQGPALGLDYVVLYHGANDLRARALPPERRVPASLPFVPRSLERGIAWAQGQGHGAERLPYRLPDEKDIKELEKQVQRLIYAISRVRARPIFATHALRVAPDATGARAQAQAGELSFLLGVHPDATVQWFNAWNRIVVAAAKRSGAPLADVRAAVMSNAENWGDATHFATPGAERAATAVATAVLRDLAQQEVGSPSNGN